MGKIECKYVVFNRLQNKKDPNSGYGEIQEVDINSSPEEVMISLNKLAKAMRAIHIQKAFPKVKIIGGERWGCMFCKFKGNTHPLCNSKYNQYVELLEQHSKSA